VTKDLKVFRVRQVLKDRQVLMVLMVRLVQLDQQVHRVFRENGDERVSKVQQDLRVPQEKTAMTLLLQ
jgi:hypothetical protein